jgi:hypothetical protein
MMTMKHQENKEWMPAMMEEMDEDFPHPLQRDSPTFSDSK